MARQFKSLVSEDRGVSPVIGVILMVAITVILAAVIGTFVLGLGDSLNQAPQSQLNADSDASQSVNISHSGGDALPYSEITIQINDSDVDVPGDVQGSPGEELSVGDSIGILLDDTSDADSTGLTLTNGYTAGDPVQITIIHNPSESILFDTEIDTQG